MAIFATGVWATPGDLKSRELRKSLVVDPDGVVEEEVEDEEKKEPHGVLQNVLQSIVPLWCQSMKDYKIIV